MDFSYPYFTSGLQIMVDAEQPSFLNALVGFVTSDLLKLIAIVIGVLIVVAHGVWLFERHTNADFPRQYLPGVGEAYGAPVLQHYATTDGAGRVQLVGRPVQPEQYAIALPFDSPYRRAIDQTLLQLMADGSYDALYQRWFGENR